MNIFGDAIVAFPAGSKLPGTNYTVKGLGKRHGEEALIYLIPNNRGFQNKQDEKGFSKSDLERAHNRLSSHKEFTRKWFESAMRECSKGAPCNFLAIGAVFCGLNLAFKKKPGVYALCVPPRDPTLQPAPEKH